MTNIPYPELRGFKHTEHIYINKKNIAEHVQRFTNKISKETMYRREKKVTNKYYLFAVVVLSVQIFAVNKDVLLYEIQFPSDLASIKKSVTLLNLFFSTQRT